MSEKAKRGLTIGVIGIVLVFCCPGGPAYAQDRNLNMGERGSVGYFVGGFGWVLESGNSSILYSTGGGGHGITNRWILGGEGHSSFGPSNAGGFGFLNLGYLVLPLDHVLVYPLLGLGGGSLTREGSPSVSRCALLNPSVEVDFLIPMRRSSGILVGLRAGYTFTVYSDTWNWSMPHLHLVVGGFGSGGS